MKKIGFILGMTLILGACQGVSIRTAREAAEEPTVAAFPSQGAVTLMIDTGEETATYSGRAGEATTVLELLRMTAAEYKMPLETKDYDFGTMVESIKGKKNNTNKAWIYYVNGMPGEVGAGGKIVQTGDVVEWKYVPPIY